MPPIPYEPGITLDKPMPPPAEGSSPTGKRGLLKLTLGPRAGRTRLLAARQRVPLHVGRVLYPQSDWPELAHLTVSMPTGGLVQGDRTMIHLAAEPGTIAHLSSQSATRVYRCETADVRQRLEIELSETAYLEWWPDPLIPYAGADFSQEAHLNVHPGATLVYADSFIAGRLARGECHAYRQIRSSTLVSRPAGQAVCRDLLWFQPAFHAPGQLGLLGAAGAVGTVLLLGPAIAERLEAELARAMALKFPSVAATTRLPSDVGLLVRILAQSPETLRRVHALVLTVVRHKLWGRSAPYQARS